MATCSRCGKSLEDRSVTYSADGSVVCERCTVSAEIVSDERHAARNMKTAAWSCLGLGALSWFFDPVFVVTVVGILAAIYAIRSALPGNKRFTKYLRGRDRVQIWGCIGIGIALMALKALIILLALTAAACVH